MAAEKKRMEIAEAKQVGALACSSSVAAPEQPAARGNRANSASGDSQGADDEQGYG